MGALKKTDRIVVPVIIILSVIIPLVVLVLMNMPARYDIFGLDMGTYPFFHAMLNGATAFLLLVGYILIRKGEKKLHRNVMITAFFLSCIFLGSYVISKLSNDPVPYAGDGFLKPIYLFVLITHIVLSIVIVPLVLFTMYRGLTGEYVKHRRIARWTFPIWLYVAVTGVLVYLFMLPYY